MGQSTSEFHSALKWPSSGQFGRWEGYVQANTSRLRKSQPAVAVGENSHLGNGLLLQRGRDPRPTESLLLLQAGLTLPTKKPAASAAAGHLL